MRPHLVHEEQQLDLDWKLWHSAIVRDDERRVLALNELGNGCRVPRASKHVRTRLLPVTLRINTGRQTPLTSVMEGAVIPAADAAAGSISAVARAAVRASVKNDWQSSPVSAANAPTAACTFDCASM